ncbi:MAG: alpha/beta fold hydrolase [Dehalococcoidia bacterium]
MTVPGGLLLLHGYLSGAVAWAGVREALGTAIPVCAPDLPGYGRARRVPAGSLDALVEHLVPLVERERPAFVLGHSMGGIVALALAARFPDQFRRVGLTGLPVYDGREDGLAYLHERGLGHRLLLHHDGLSHAGCTAVHAVRRLWVPWAPLVTPRQPREHAMAAFDHSRESHSEGLNAVVFAGHVHGLAARVSQPVVALHGGRDRSARIDRVRELAGRHGWDVRVAPTGNHQLIIERPAMVARWIRERLLAGEDSSCPPAEEG